MTPDDRWFNEAGSCRSAEILAIDYSLAEARLLGHVIDGMNCRVVEDTEILEAIILTGGGAGYDFITPRREPLAVYVGDVDQELGLPPGTLVYGDGMRQFWDNYVQWLRKPLPLASDEALAYRLHQPFTVNRTPMPMKEPHRSDWAQRRPRRRRRR